ncbi:V-set and immunoglobulin domain-containing protein 10 isoform X1 [Bos taurus]|uniref:WD repeat and SOCS box containing 2 n=2 Tax=Bos TaxID=9903 RepID=E1BP24_BOVIN|nr:V-set and immunoglobulin domain-containing protein 10 isoform X1 [Bos taurus]
MPSCGSCRALHRPLSPRLRAAVPGEWARGGTSLGAPPPACPDPTRRARARALCIKPSSSAKVEEVGLPPGWEAGGNSAPVVFRQREWVAGAGGGVRPPTTGWALGRDSGAWSPAQLLAPDIGLTPSILPGGCGKWSYSAVPRTWEEYWVPLGSAHPAEPELEFPEGPLPVSGARWPQASGRPSPGFSSASERCWPAGSPQGNGKKRRLSRIKKDSNSLTFPCTGLEAVTIGEIHENITLHCGNISGPRGLVTWCRNDSESVFLLSSSSSLPPAQSRFSLVNASALHIEALNLQDEGNYTCSEVLNKTETRRFQVWLQVANGPSQVEVNISSTGRLPNGTLYAAKGSQVDFSCSSRSQPPPVIEWWFQAPDSTTELFGNNLTASCFTLLLMSQNLQGNYTCLAKNVLSGRHRKVTTELLVYSPPPSAPQCWAEVSPGLFSLQLNCRWAGGYPDPDFLWTEEPGGVVVGTSKLGVEMLSQSQLSDGKKFKCVGSHIVGPELGASCVVQIRSPSLLSEPMKTCFVGGSVTLTCQVSGAYPPAKIMWLRNLTQPKVVIQPSGHHLITQSGQSSTLTIRNCSQDLDEGYYVCRAENAVGVREVDIWLSVKEPLNIGGIVATVVSLLLLGLAIITGLLLYYSPVFCWKVGSTFRRQDMGDVMVLVDSEEEEMEEEEDAAEEEEEEASEREESPIEITKYGHIHRVTALVNGNVDQMGNGLQALQDDSSEQQSDIIQEEDRPV